MNSSIKKVIHFYACFEFKITCRNFTWWNNAELRFCQSFYIRVNLLILLDGIISLTSFRKKRRLFFLSVAELQKSRGKFNIMVSMTTKLNGIISWMPDQYTWNVVRTELICKVTTVCIHIGDMREQWVNGTPRNSGWWY